MPGGSTLATTWTNLYPFISGAGSQATWTNVVNSTTGMGISQWKNFFIYQPWSHGIGLGCSTVDCPRPADISGVSGAWERRRRLRLWAVRRPSANCRCHPAGRRHPGDQARRYVVARRGFCRDGSSDDGGPAERAQPGQLGQLGRWRARQPGFPRRQLDGRAGQGDHARAVEGPVPLDKVIAKLQESPDEVQHWDVDEAGLDDLVAKLSTKPGIHAVHLTDGKATAAVAKAATETG